MDILLHILEVELLIALGLFAIAYLTVRLSLWFFTGGRKRARPRPERH